MNAPNALLPREPALADPRPGAPWVAERASQRHTPTIGIDARAATEVPAGRGRVVRELLRALARREDDVRYLLYARTPWTEQPLDERFAWSTIAAREPWWHLRAAQRANRECDVFLSSNSYLTARFLRIPCVPIVYDLVTFDRAMRPNRRSQVIERLTLGPAVRRAAALIAISQATADALAEQCPGSAARTVVAPLGVAPALAGKLDPAEAATLPAAGFVLAAGTLEPRKNLPRLVEAYRRLPAELRRAHPLVVVGALGWETGATLRALDSLGAEAIRLGYVSDCGARRALPPLRRLLLPLARRGLRAARARGDGRRRRRPDLRLILTARGRRRRRRLRRPARRRQHRRRARPRPARRGRPRRARPPRPQRAAGFSWERFAESVSEVLAGAADGKHDAARNAQRTTDQLLSTRS